MPRSRSAPRPAAAPRPKPAASSSGWGKPAQQQHSAPPPAPHAASAPPPAMQQGGGGGMFSGLMGSMVTGAAMGTGSAMAHRAVDSFMGPRGGSSSEAPAAAAPAPEQFSQAPVSGPCAEQAKAFAECMSRHNGDMGACQWYFEHMQQCKVNSPYA